MNLWYVWQHYGTTTWGPSAVKDPHARPAPSLHFLDYKHPITCVGQQQWWWRF